MKLCTWNMGNDRQKRILEVGNLLNSCRRTFVQLTDEKTEAELSYFTQIHIANGRIMAPYLRNKTS